MRRPLLIGILGFGTVFGFGSGFASLAHHHHARRDAFERHVADVCVEAAHRAEDRRATPVAYEPVYDEPVYEEPPPPRRHRRHHHRSHR